MLRAQFGQLIVVAICSIVCWNHSSFLAAQEPVTQEELAEQQKKQMERQMVMTQIIQLQYNTELRDELSLVPEQLEEIKKLGQEYQQAMIEFQANASQHMKKYQRLVEEGDSEKLQQLSIEIQQQLLDSTEHLMAKAETTLLPHQLERIKQIGRQQSYRQINEFGDEFGIPFAMATELGLDDDQIIKLRDTIVEVRKEYYEKVEELKADAKKEILESIPADKRDQMEEMLGEDFDADRSLRRSREQIAEDQKKKREQQMRNRKKKQDDGK